MDCPDFGVCNPSVIQPNVRRQATLNRDTDSVVVLTPNVELVVASTSLPVFDEERPDPCLGQSSEPAPDDA